MTGQAGGSDLLVSGDVKTAGIKIDTGRFLLMIEKVPGAFPIVTR